MFVWQRLRSYVGVTSDLLTLDALHKLNETELTAGYVDLSIIAQVFEEMLIEIIVN